MVGAAGFLLVAVWFVPWEPVAGGAPDPVSARSVFTAAQIERAEEFSSAARFWSWSSLAVSLLVACWLGFGRRGRALADRTRGPQWLRVVTVVALLALIGRLATLPFAIGYRRLALDAGLSTSSWGAWALDLVKGELVAIVSTSIALAVLLTCVRRWQRSWPAIAGALLAGFVVIGSFVYPVLVEPLFNTFTPLDDGRLRDQIVAVAEREGVEIDDVLVADASRRTTTLNAYVSGFGGTKRVVLYDNLVADDVPQGEVVSVVAHELAHAKHDDVVLGTALGALGALCAGGLLGVVTDLVRRRGRPDMGDVGAVPMVLALAALATVLVAPVQNGISRQIETRADVTALRSTDAPQPFVELQRRLAIRSLADPTPPALSQWWFGSHPTVLHRVATAEAVLGPLP
ncbi:M48 family metallopeptidase [Nocardioides thalensis]|uniref:M48 family metallopeptidase n=1 Tax=Nocardioides thalensis TaxID=1914755 RepID=UPI0015CBF9B4|nr:M48 family metallopeptidase [Nocardioides thalensis]